MAAPIVPRLVNGDIGSPAEVDDLLAHLDRLESDSQLAPDVRLFDNVTLQLTDTTSTAILPIFLPRLSNLLRNTTHDPAPYTSLLARLLRPVPFSTVLQLAPPDSLAQALSTHAPPSANLLGLELVSKASANPSDAAILASQNLLAVFESLLTVWMGASDVDVGTGAGRVILAVLEADSPTLRRVRWGDPIEGAARDSLPPLVTYETDNPGTGLLWDRLFSSRLIDLIVEPCTGSPSPHSRQVTLAQDRLLRILPQLAVLSYPAVSTLLRAASTMVDPEDELMARCAADSFENLVCMMRVSTWAQDPHLMRRLGMTIRHAIDTTAEVRYAVLELPSRVVAEEREATAAWVDRLYRS